MKETDRLESIGIVRRLMCNGSKRNKMGVWGLQWSDSGGTGASGGMLTTAVNFLVPLIAVVVKLYRRILLHIFSWIVTT